MPELTDDHIEDLFAELRAGEMPQISPPGVAAARTTVRRRRTTTSIAAGVVVLAMAGGIAALGGTHSAYRSATTNADTASELKALTDRAQEAIEDYIRVRDPFPRTAVSQGSAGVESVAEVSDATEPGPFVITMACVGTGSLYVRLNSTTSSGKVVLAASRQLDCDEENSLKADDIEFWSGGPLSFTLAAVGVGPYRSGFAYKIFSGEHRERVKAKVAEATPGGAVRADEMAIAGSSFFSVDGRPGSYVIRAACLGRGHVTITARQGPSEDDKKLGEKEVPCSDEPEVVNIPFSFSKKAPPVWIGTASSESAQGHSWYAFSVTRA